MKREIKSTAHIGHCAEFLTQNSCVLDIETDSRYWRTSHFNNVRLADTEKEIIWIPEKESDEYDLLITLAESLSQYSHIVTFSGTGFDLPHLRKKYSAYRLSDPLQDKRHDDLFLMLRKYNALLPLARHRLNDYVSLFKESRAPDDDAQKALFITRILSLTCLTEGRFDVQITDSDFPETDIFKERTRDLPSYGTVLSLLLTPDLPISFRVRCSDGPFELDSDPESGTLLLRIRSDDGSFYMYHSDFENYDYLPGEGCAVHKSLTAYVASDRKAKASRDNCYTRIPCGTLLQGNEKTLKKYTEKTVAYLLGGPS